MRALVVLVVTVLVATGDAAAAELRGGFHFAGHLLFTDVAAATVQWAALQRADESFLREVDLESGLALSFDGKFLEVPALVRVELYRWWMVGVELAPGLVISRYEGISAMTPVLCAGLPVTARRLRVEPELCLNASAGPPGGLSYRGGLWTGLGIGVLYAF